MHSTEREGFVDFGRHTADSLTLRTWVTVTCMVLVVVLGEDCRLRMDLQEGEVGRHWNSCDWDEAWTEGCSIRWLPLLVR